MIIIGENGSYVDVFLALDLHDHIFKPGACWPIPGFICLDCVCDCVCLPPRLLKTIHVKPE